VSDFDLTFERLATLEEQRRVIRTMASILNRHLSLLEACFDDLKEHLAEAAIVHSRPEGDSN
jgi:hypothetical protein